MNSLQSSRQMVDLENPVSRRELGKQSKASTAFRFPCRMPSPTCMGKLIIFITLLVATLLTISLWGGMTSVSTRRRLPKETSVGIEDYSPDEDTPEVPLPKPAGHKPVTEVMTLETAIAKPRQNLFTGTRVLVENWTKSGAIDSLPKFEDFIIKELGERKYIIAEDAEYEGCGSYKSVFSFNRGTRRKFVAKVSVDHFDDDTKDHTTEIRERQWSCLKDTIRPRDPVSCDCELCKKIRTVCVQAINWFELTYTCNDSTPVVIEIQDYGTILGEDEIHHIEDFREYLKVKGQYMEDLRRRNLAWLPLKPGEKHYKKPDGTINPDGFFVVGKYKLLVIDAGWMFPIEQWCRLSSEPMANSIYQMDSRIVGKVVKFETAALFLGDSEGIKISGRKVTHVSPQTSELGVEVGWMILEINHKQLRYLTTVTLDTDGIKKAQSQIVGFVRKAEKAEEALVVTFITKPVV